MREKNRVNTLWDGGPIPVARGGSGSGTPPLAARPKELQADDISSTNQKIN